MSKFVDEIVESINTDPRSWAPHHGMYSRRNDGLKKGGLEIEGYGNSKLLSIIHLNVGGIRTTLTYSDKRRLESAVSWWYETAPLSAITEN
jgi:hypothetical protein